MISYPIFSGVNPLPAVSDPYLWGVDPDRGREEDTDIRGLPSANETATHKTGREEFEKDQAEN